MLHAFADGKATRTRSGCRRKSGIGDDCLQQPPLVQEGNRSVGFGVDCRYLLIVAASARNGGGDSLFGRWLSRGFGYKH